MSHNICIIVSINSPQNFLLSPATANAQLRKATPQPTLWCSLICHRKCPEPSFDLSFFSMYTE